jgi:glycosyltransferase involved in cell wall biosynthesis
LSLPTLSVLIPNYNQGTYIKEAFEEILNQTWRPIEIIVVDDCSTDDSIEIIESCSKNEPLIRLIQHEKNKGSICTLQRLCEEAKGDYIHLTAPDDPVYPGLYKKSMELLTYYPQAGLCSTLVECIDEKKRKLCIQPGSPFVSKVSCYLSPDEVLNSYLKFGNWFTASSAIWQREKFINLGAFSAVELSSYLDTFRFYQMALNNGVCFIPEVLNAWRVTSGGWSAKSRYDPQVYWDLLNRAERLMRTSLHDQFPEKFIENFIRRELATFGNVVFNKMDSELEISLSFLSQALPENNVADRVVIRFAQLLMRVQNIFLKVYLGFRLRRFNGIFLLRMIYHAKDCMKKLIK